MFRDKVVSWYKSVFDDSDFCFLVSVALYSSVVVSMLISAEFEVVGGSIFIACGAVIAGALSYMAIEGTREIKEKEIERNELESYCNLCLEMATESLELSYSGGKLVSMLKKHGRLGDQLGTLRSDLGRVLKEIGDLKEVNKGNVNDETIEDRRKRAQDLKNRLDKVSSVYDDSAENINEELDKLVEKINKIIEFRNKIRLNYHRVKSNHYLDGIDIECLEDAVESFKNSLRSSVDKIFSAVSSVMGDKEVDGLKKKDYLERGGDYYGFEDPSSIYPSVEMVFKSPGLHVERKSARYIVIHNRCVAVSIFFVVVGVLNGFDFS